MSQLLVNRLDKDYSNYYKMSNLQTWFTHWKLPICYGISLVVQIYAPKTTVW